VSAYDPPLADTDNPAGPPRYENGAKSTLAVFTWGGLIGGLVLFGTAAVLSAGNEAPETAGIALRVGIVFLALGVLALFALLAARSVTYDLMYRFGPRPDYRPADSTEPSPTVDNTEHFTPEATR